MFLLIFDLQYLVLRFVSTLLLEDCEHRSPYQWCPAEVGLLLWIQQYLISRDISDKLADG